MNDSEHWKRQNIKEVNVLHNNVAIADAQSELYERINPAKEPSQTDPFHYSAILRKLGTRSRAMKLAAKNL